MTADTAIATTEKNELCRILFCIGRVTLRRYRQANVDIVAKHQKE